MTPPPAHGFDVLGLGVVAVDDLLQVDAYPPPDAKTAIRQRERQGGGLTGTALVAASRLGSRCAYAGVLGYDELSDYVIARLRQEGVDLTHLLRRDGVRPVYAVVIVDRTHHTRNIFYDSGAGAGADPEWPPEEVIQGSRVLFVDRFGLPGMIRAARLARAAGRPVVADFEGGDEPEFMELLALVDHLVIPREYGEMLTGESDPLVAAIRLLPGRKAVVLTGGADGAWYVGAEAPNQPRHQPAFRVQVVDTTGCGDVFHGAYAAALARGLGLAERVRIAAAAAALKATQPGGQAGIPTREEVVAFTSVRRPVPEARWGA